MHKWHYKTLVIRELALSESKLNAEGAKGWELVGVCMETGSTARAFFKMAYDEELGLPPDIEHQHALVGAGQEHH